MGTVGCYFFLLTGMTLYVGHQTATKLQTFKFRFSSADELRSRASNLYEASSAVMSRENFKRFLNEELHLEFGPNAVDAAIYYASCIIRIHDGARLFTVPIIWFVFIPIV